MRTCGWQADGVQCTVSLEGRPKCTQWCKEHADLIKHSRHGRKRSKAIRRGRKKPSPNAHVVKNRLATLQESPRVAQLKCKVCGGMPWALEPGRTYEVQNGTLQPVLGADGKCSGCGAAYAPEPRGALPTLIASNAAMAMPWAW